LLGSTGSKLPLLNKVSTHTLTNVGAADCRVDLPNMHAVGEGHIGQYQLFLCLRPRVFIDHHQCKSYKS